jgi:hypothetical protein
MCRRIRRGRLEAISRSGPDQKQDWLTTHASLPCIYHLLLMLYTFTLRPISNLSCFRIGFHLNSLRSIESLLLQSQGD